MSEVPMSSDRETTLRDAVIAFLAKWPDAKKAIDSVCLIAHVHGAGYSGPTLGVEIEAMQAALASTPPASVPVEPSGRLRHHDVALLGQASGARRRFGGVRGEGMSERETALKAGDELVIREGKGIERRVRYIGVRDHRKRYAVRNTSTGRLSYIHPRDPRARCAFSGTPLIHITEVPAGADPVPPQVCQWREIATAPMDWSPVIVYDAESGEVGQAYYSPEDGGQNAWMWANLSIDDESCFVAYPTHWMPLPAPPVVLVPAEGESEPAAPQSLTVMEPVVDARHAEEIAAEVAKRVKLADNHAKERQASNDELRALREQLAAVQQALRMLRNESHGIRAMSYDAIKDSAGYTNLKVWTQRIEEADATIAALSSPSTRARDLERLLTPEQS